ncbi:hypothetical protein [Azorhizobium sp. AG788]|uniref:hypothetical protein n=1 Tax=Azorhizobium sp. AG788 TaxID=2183897 RepID=UPI00105DC17F|nr:hypothetical protein [Azorhizobium sp. AG788]
MNRTAIDFLLLHNAVEACPFHDEVMLDLGDIAAVDDAIRAARGELKGTMRPSEIAEFCAEIRGAARELPFDCPRCEHAMGD